MTLLYPLGLLGLLSIPVLILLDRLRRRPQPLAWPSLLLWKEAAAEAPSRRRARDPLLLLECAAAALLSLAAARPALIHGVRARRVEILVDENPYMEARRDGTTVKQATDAELARLRAALGSADRVSVFPVKGDVFSAAAALTPGDLRVVATDRADVKGPGLLVIGRSATGHNAGISSVQARADSVWAAVETDGPQREVTLDAGNKRVTLRTGTGVVIPWPPDETTLALKLEDGGNLSRDDACTLERIDLAAHDETGSRYVRAALFAAGLPAHESKTPALTIAAGGGQPIPNAVRGAEITVHPGLFQDLYLDGCSFTGASTRPGMDLATYEGKGLAGWEGKTLWLGLPVDRPWDSHGTLAVLIEHAKRAVAERLARGRAVVGTAYASPPPRFFDTRGVDRPFRGALPPARRELSAVAPLRAIPAALAALLLLFYLRAMLRRQ